MECIFCKIAAKEAAANIVHETEELLAFDDIHPQAPVHILVVSRRHIPTVNDLRDSDAAMLGRMILCAKEIAKKKAIDVSGYRLVFNCNDEGGQAVYHIHLHLLGGRPLGGKICR